MILLYEIDMWLAYLAELISKIFIYYHFASYIFAWKLAHFSLLLKH